MTHSVTSKEAPQIEPVSAQRSGPRSGAARFTCVPWQRLTHASHGSRPHRELHRRPQWQGSHASPGPFRHTPHTVRGPIESSTEGLCGRVRLRPQADLVGHTPHTVAPDWMGVGRFRPSKGLKRNRSRCPIPFLHSSTSSSSSSGEAKLLLLHLLCSLHALRPLEKQKQKRQ